MRVWLVGLALLAGCVPVAVLRSPEPVQGATFTLGGSVFPSPASGSRYPVWGLPYFAYAQGDGAWEWNFSVQWSLRVGGKVALGEGLSLDGGLSFWPGFGETQGAFSGDLGLLLGRGGFYLSPRIHLTLDWDGRLGSVPQLTLGYRGEGWALEGGYGPIGPYLAVGFFWQTVPEGP